MVRAMPRFVQRCGATGYHCSQTLQLVQSEEGPVLANAAIKQINLLVAMAVVDFSSGGRSVALNTLLADR